MRRSILAFAATLCASAALSAAPAAAQGYRDVWSGLTIAPPAGYSTYKLPADADYKIRVDVLRADDNPRTGCRVNFQPTDQNAALTQAGVNMLVLHKGARAAIAASLAKRVVVRSTRLVRYGEVGGVEVVGDGKRLPGAPARAPKERIWAVVMVTPKGHGSVICVDVQARFDRRRAEYDAVARGARLPG